MIPGGFKDSNIIAILKSIHILGPNLAKFLKQELETLKHIITEGQGFRSRWLGQENEENVAQTRSCCGWPSSPRQRVSMKPFTQEDKGNDVVHIYDYARTIIYGLTARHAVSLSSSRVYLNLHLIQAMNKYMERIGGLCKRLFARKIRPSVCIFAFENISNWAENCTTQS